MKQKVVIKLSLNENDQKYRSKALKIAVSQPGVESAAMHGDGEDQLEVVGDQIDAVALMSLLRDNLGQAELVSVGPADGDDKKDDKAGSDTTLEDEAMRKRFQTPLCLNMSAYQCPLYQNKDSYVQPGCSIM